MADKRILIAIADPPTLAEYGRGLSKEWTIKLVTSPDAALAEMATATCDVLVADFALPQINGTDLLDRVHSEYPKTIRILLVGESDKDKRMADVEGSHLVLPKPCDSPTLRSAIERALAIDLWLANDSLRELVARLRTFPIVPSLYLEVINALKLQHTTTAEVGAIIAKDMAMTTKLLQVTNSACFGLPRKISDPVEAVGILGFETVKSMVMTLKLLSQYDKVKPVYFSIDRLWRHSTEVARISRRIVLTETDDPGLAGSAFTAGLMHDLGKLVLASNFDEQYSGAQSLARKQQIPLWEVEKQIFGATHGEIGAYLLGLWGMPLDLVESSALHHNPGRSQSKQFTALTAVHVANALVYEAKPDKEGFIPPQVDEQYIAGLGLSDHLQRWREMVMAPDLEVTEFRARSGETVFIKKPAPAAPKPALRPAKPSPSPALARTAAARAQLFSSPRERWICIGMGLAIFVLAFIVGTQAIMRMTVPLPPASEHASLKLPPATNVPATPPPQVAEVVPATNPPAKVEEPAAVPTPAITNTVAALAPAAPPEPTAKDRAFSELQLQTIFYSQANPSAVISGQRVRPQDHLKAGAVVVAISPSSVTVEFDHERKVLALK
jgi:HD-like signal output (HDOD) protein/CheY-like chemotaxis protein